MTSNMYEQNALLLRQLHEERAARKSKQSNEKTDVFLHSNEKTDVPLTNENKEKKKVMMVIDLTDDSIPISTEYDDLLDQEPIQDDYKPKNTRYILVINDIKAFDGEIYVYKNLCNNYNTSYNPKDYTIEKCLNYTVVEDDYLRLDRALDLINKKYWRYMGNSKY